MAKKRLLKILVLFVILMFLASCTIDLAGNKVKTKKKADAKEKKADKIQGRKNIPISENFTEKDCIVPMIIIDDVCCYDNDEDGLCDISTEGAVCGNNVCEVLENECSCKADCGKCGEGRQELVCMHYECSKNDECAAVDDDVCCGDGICDENTEICTTCFQDCCSLDTISDFKKDLKNYPQMAAGLSTIVGDKAPPDDVVIAADIATHIALENLSVGSGKLASEINLTKKDHIIIGNPCDNKAAFELFRKEIYNNNQSCQIFGFGEGLVKIFPTSKNNVAIYVGGYTPVSTEKAAKILIDYKDKKPTGSEVGV